MGETVPSKRVYYVFVKHYGKLHLSQDDIENIIAQRIKEIQDKLDESYYKIKNGEIALLRSS